MRVYAVVVEDRHADIDVCSIHYDRGFAINKARTLAKEYCRHEEDYEERTFPGSGLIFAGTYSCESDNVGVYESELFSYSETPSDIT